jgi:hypothetical protein
VSRVRDNAIVYFDLPGSPSRRETFYPKNMTKEQMQQLAHTRLFSCNIEQEKQAKTE